MITLNKTSFLDAPIQVESMHGVTFSSENKGHQFVISAMRGGELVALTGTVTAKFMRSNNTTILIAGSGYAGIVDGKATVTLHQDCYNIPGRFQLAIFVTENGATSCIYACVGMVQRTQNGDLIDSGDVVPSLEELLEKIDDCEQATVAANAAAAAVPNLVAETFSTSKSYYIGDYVYYNGGLYRFIADHSAGDWNASEVMAVKLANDVNYLRDDFDYFADTKRKRVFGGTYSGTRRVITNVNIPAGEYLLTVDNVVSSDTDAETSAIYFYYSDGGETHVQLERGNSSEVNVTFEKTVVTVHMFASTKAVTSDGDVFTFSNVALGRIEEEYAVRFDTEQALTDAQKERVRTNIDGASKESVDELEVAFKGNYEGLISAKENIVRIPNAGNIFYYESDNHTHRYCGSFDNVVVFDYTTTTANNRLPYTGTATKFSTAQPTYAARPDWFVDDIPDFIVGHEYYFNVKLLSGEIGNDGRVKSFGLMTKDGSLNTGVAIGDTWTCTAKPQNVYINVGPGTYTKCVWYCYIVDKTLADAEIKTIKEDIEALQEAEEKGEERLSSVSIKNVEIAKIENVLTSEPLKKLMVDLPFVASSTDTPMPDNVVSYTLHNSVSVYFGSIYGTPTSTKNIVLSEAWESLYCGSIDFINGKIYKKYDWFLMDGVTDGLKFVEASNGNYVVSNPKLRNAVNSFRCFSTWLPSSLLRVNANNGFIYGYPADYGTIGITSVEDLNAQVVAKPLLVLFELSVPEEHDFDVTAVYAGDGYAWASEGTLTVEYAAFFTDATEVIVENERTRLHRSNTISSLPTYKIPVALHYNKTPYFYDIIGNPYTTNSYYRTNGIGYDGVRYIYYALGAGDYYALRKVDIWTKKVVATGEVANHGHWETLAFVPNWVSGFDNGTVDRIYETTLDEHKTVKVFDANTLELISSFPTDTLISSPYYNGTHRLLFNQNHGKFVLSSGTATVDGGKYFTFAIADMNGNIEKCVRLKDVGTGCGFDSDDNFIYMLKDISGEVDRMLVLDWNLSPVTMATFTHEDYEPEGLYHIGDTFYMLYNIENRMGVHIWEYACVNEFSDTKPTFPMSGWVNTLIDPESFVEITVN